MRQPVQRPARRRGPAGLGRQLVALAILCFGIGAGAPATAQTESGATITVSPTAIPLSAAEIVNPTRGFYRWYGGEPIPQPRPAYDHYARYGWRQLEPSRDQYDFSALEAALQDANNSGAKFSFRVMSVNEFSSPVEIPDYLKQEAGGKNCTYNGKSLWVPNWDSPQFLARAQALITALGIRFDGDPRLGYYDIGIYGHWGEWHTGGLCTPDAGAATKRALVDMQVAAFPRSRILMNSGGKEVDAFVYALGKSPRIGVRVDSLCDPAFDHQFTDSPEKLAAMQARWKTAPIVSEFHSPNPADLALCDQQVKQWHVAAVANTGIGTWGSYTPEQQAQILQIGKDSGYRFELNTLTYPAEVTTSIPFTIVGQWSNVGVTPAYEDYAVVFELRPQGQTMTAWAGISQLDLEQLLPAAQPHSISDRLLLPSWLAAGPYTLSLVVRDRANYRAPLALAIAGADSSGRYPLGTLMVRPGPAGKNVFLAMAQR
jgi:hypothetical protein